MPKVKGLKSPGQMQYLSLCRVNLKQLQLQVVTIFRKVKSIYCRPRHVECSSRREDPADFDSFELSLTRISRAMHVFMEDRGNEGRNSLPLTVSIQGDLSIGLLLERVNF